MLLKIRANPKQKLALQKWNDDTTVEILYGGGKNGGKSYLGVTCIFHDALVYPETMYFIARHTLNDLVKFTIPSIQEVFKHWGIDINAYAKYNGQLNMYTCYNGSRVYLIDCKHIPSDDLYERFGSMQMTRGWIEEGGEIPAAAKENLSLTIGRYNNDQYGLKPKLLITCNPKKNWMYTDFYKPWKDGVLPKSKAFIQALVGDNVFRQSNALDQLQALKSKAAKERLLYGNWEYDDGPDAMIPYEAIVDLFHNSHVAKDSNDRWLVCDIAMQGADMFVLSAWEGWVRVETKRIPKSDGKAVLGHIEAMKIRHKIPNSRIIYDADGLGAFLKGDRGFLPGAYAFQNNASPVQIEGPKKYRNLKAQCQYIAAERINNRQMYLADAADSQEIQDRIGEELGQWKTKDADKENALDIQPKNVIKANIGRSPDEADTILMRMYPEVMPKRTGRRSSFA